MTETFGLPGAHRSTVARSSARVTAVMCVTFDGHGRRGRLCIACTVLLLCGLPDQLQSRGKTVMSDHEVPEQSGITRRETLKLVAAVASLGAALGMRPTDSIAQGKEEGKAEGKADGKADGKGEGKAKKGEGKAKKGEGKAKKGESKEEGKAEEKAEGKDKK